MFVDGLTHVAVQTYADVEMLMEEGMRNRHVAATKMNAQSSRSHSIFDLRVRQMSAEVAERLAAAAGAKNKVTKGKKSKGGDDDDGVLGMGAKISLVDLAGSERVKDCGTTSGTHINKS